MNYDPSQPTDFDATSMRLAWAHLAVGSGGVIAVSALYFLAPALAVAANLRVDMTLARAAALSDAGYLQLVGLLGVVADPAIAVGAFMLAQKNADGRQASGLYWLAAASLVFTLVDALAGFALLASAKAGVETFGITKGLFDVLTGGASVGYGLSAVLIALPPSAAGAVGPAWLMQALRTTGIAVAFCGCAVLLSFDAGLPLGLGLAILTTLYTVFSIWNIKNAPDLPTAAIRTLARD